MKRVILFFLAFLPLVLFLACAAPKNTPESSTEGSVSSDISGDSKNEASESAPQLTDGNKISAAISSSAPTSTAHSDNVPRIKQILIPEGYTFLQVANTLEKNGICKAKDFFEAAQGYTTKSFNTPNNKNAAYRYEGYLFPATYWLEVGEDPTEVLKKMLNAYAQYSGMPDAKTLILASVIEKETRSTEQMRMISSVFTNRIKIGMQLGSDVTREYVNDNIVQAGTWIKNADRFRILFNTTRSDFVGSLPAGPICSPGKRAIDAAENPAKSDYLFFFFGADNQNHYAKTYEEHLELIEKFGLG